MTAVKKGILLFQDSIASSTVYALPPYSKKAQAIINKLDASVGV